MEQKKTKRIVQLRVFKGETLSFDAAGEPVNPNQLVKLQPGTLEWKNFLKHLKINGFFECRVEKVFDETKQGWKELNDKECDPYKLEVSEALGGKGETPYPKSRPDFGENAEEQYRAKLEAKLNAMTVKQLKEKYPAFVALKLKKKQEFVDEALKVINF